MQRSALAVVLASGLGWAGLAADAQAQGDNQDAARIRSASKGIEEIVVTARKREETLQDAPLSVTAFSQDAMKSQSIESLNDIGEATPNLVFSQSSNNYNPRIYIRGVGSDDAVPTIDPGVGVYVDGVYLARTNSLNLDLLDIERVEVLRGPQGTLYGRNTIGGAINITTTQPSGEWGTTLKANVGTQGRLDTGVSIDFPVLEEKLSGRVSFASTYHEGFFDNSFAGGSDWSNDRGLAGRATLLFTPNDWSSYQPIIDRPEKRSHPSGINIDSLCPTGANPVFCANFGTGTGLLDLAAAQLENSHFKSSLDNGANSVFNRAGAPSDRGENTIDATGTALISSFDLTPATQLKLTTSYRRLESRDSIDVDGLPLSLVDVFNHGLNNQVSQEIQLNTTLFDDRASWISGVYLFYEDSKLESDANNLADAALQPGLFATETALFGPSGGSVALSAFAARLSSVVRTDQQTRSYAAYSHMEYDLTDRLSIEGGLRYTYDHKRFKIFSLLRNGSVSANRRDTEHWDDWSPMVGANFQATDDVLLYARWSRGFRSGQFNGRATDLNPLTTGTVDPETVKVTEIGVKSSWLDQQLVVNFAAFRNNFTDQQLTTFTFDGARFVSIVQNAGKSRILGAEADVMFRATNDLSLFGSIGVLNAKYQTFREPVLVGGGERDVSDRDFKNTPELSFNLGAEYTFPSQVIGGWLQGRVDYSHQSQVYYNTSNTDSIRQDKVGLLNGRIAWANTDDTMEIAIWGRNLLDREWDAFGLDLTAALGFSSSYPAAPLQAGVSFTLRY